MIYFDYAATSIKRKEILEYILKNKEDFDGNPESLHGYGRIARKILEESREKIAESLNANPENIIFTSGASESNNTIIKNFDDENFEIISTAVEHPSILEALKSTKSSVKYLHTDKNGIININYLKNNLSEKTKLVCVMLANNETGAIQPVKEIGEILKEKNIWFHVDAVQGYGHLDIDVRKLNCNSMSISGHKIGGINSFGVLFADKKIKNLIYGGEQENSLRAGTSFVAGAFSMAESYKKSMNEREKLSDLKKYFVESLLKKKIDFEINGENTAPHILNLYFPFVENQFLLTFLDLRGICISAGSACSAGSLSPSHVISDMYDEERANHSVRFSFGYLNDFSEIDFATDILKELFERKKDAKK